MPAPPCENYGDVNGDGNVSALDIQLIEKHVLGMITLTPDQIKRADVNGDGVATMADAQLITKYVVGEITTFPVCGVTPPPTEITCNSPTPNFSSGCALLLYYDVQKDGVISGNDEFAASAHAGQGTITDEEYAFVQKARSAGSINALCPGCYSATPPPVVCTPGATRCATDYILETCKPNGTGWYGSICPDGTICKNGECVPESPTPPPNMETRTMSLTEGQHTIQVSLSGYDPINATINVSSVGITCTVGPCNTQGPPGVTISGWTVTTYLKTGTVTNARCTWVATKDTSKVVFISEMVLAYNNLANIGFTPTAAEIGNAVLMYSNLGTPASLWGC